MVYIFLFVKSSFGFIDNRRQLETRRVVAGPGNDREFFKIFNKKRL